ncbi:MAG TPA: alpha/beta hydrolase [Candidatus Limnocylindrales bacterium]|nr:alpha/beta hydrolase [Candidatus Limnocylindrales bacterium]
MRARHTALAAALVACGIAACASRPPVPPGATQAAETVQTRSPGERQAAAAVQAAAPARVAGTATATDGTRIYYERIGKGPAIVFIHGLGGNHAVWFQQVAHFAPTHTVLTLSQRGFAPSGPAHGRFDVGVLVQDLTAVMDAAGIGQAVIVGQSMGGWTALGMALRNPQRVRGLVLADTVAGISDDHIAAHHRRMVEQARALSASPPPLGVHPALDAEFSRSRPDLGYLYQALSTFGSPRPGEIASQLAAARAEAAALKANRVPALFLVGSRDRIFPPAIIRRAASHLPSSRVQEIEGGHSPYFEQPAQWNRAVEDFVFGLGQAAEPVTR